MTIRFGFSLTGRGALADRATITTLAQRAEALGYDSVFVTDRMLIPVAGTKAYPYSATGAFPLGPDEPWLEALTAVTYLATVTRRIRVGTSVLVIPYRNPVFTARALATADYLSGGRVILGAGVGWWREEFQALGVPFEDRAARTVEALRLMREMWTRPRVEFEGRFWRVREAGGTRPYPVQEPRIPDLDRRAQRRRAPAGGGDRRRLASARAPPARPARPRRAGRRARRLAELAKQAGRDPRDIVIAFKAPFGFRDGVGRERTPLSGSPAQIVEDLQAYVAAGARHFVLDFTVPTPPEMLEAMERFAADVRPQVRDA